LDKERAHQKKISGGASNNWQETTKFNSIEKPYMEILRIFRNIFKTMPDGT
jgi:hypothetical protein